MKEFPEMCFPNVALTAMLGGLLVGQAANAGGGDLSFALQDMLAVTPRTARIAISVLPDTRHFDRNTNMAGIVTVAHDREEHRAVALFTVFDCRRHRFQIQVVGRVGNAMGGKLTIADLARPSESDAAMSPVAKSPWGGAVEQIACKPD